MNGSCSRPWVMGVHRRFASQRWDLPWCALAEPLQRGGAGAVLPGLGECAAQCVPLPLTHVPMPRGLFCPSRPVHARPRPAHERSTTALAVPTARHGCGAVAVSERCILVIGGEDDAFAPLPLVEAYDPVSRTWSTLSRLKASHAPCLAPQKEWGQFP